MDGNPRELIASNLDLSGVQACTDLQANTPDTVRDSGGATDRSRGAIERGYDAVSGCIDEVTPEPVE